MMSREDMMRELELLPVWKLRAPWMPNVVSSLQESTLSAEASVLDQVDHVAIKQPAYCYIQSEEGDWLFILSSLMGECNADEKLLLRNIFSAMSLTVKVISQPQVITDILSLVKPKLMVAMGEDVAQGLLKSVQSLANLRGSLHEFNNTPMVVTFDVKHLLRETSDKPKAWEDLCLAIHTLQALKKSLKAG